MSLNHGVVGQKIGPLIHTYTWKDVILYALGVGAGTEELNFVYEKNLQVIPSFAIAAVFDFFPEKVQKISCRFTKPLYPGTPIQTRIWTLQPGSAVWQVVNGLTQEVVIDLGVFEFAGQENNDR
jgi:hypothetical protein